MYSNVAYILYYEIFLIDCKSYLVQILQISDRKIKICVKNVSLTLRNALVHADLVECKNIFLISGNYEEVTKNFHKLEEGCISDWECFAQ